MENHYSDEEEAEPGNEHDNIYDYYDKEENCNLEVFQAFIHAQSPKKVCGKKTRVKKITSKKKGVHRTNWECKKEALWRVYLKTLTEDVREHAEEEKETRELFPNKLEKPSDVTELPKVFTSTKSIKCHFPRYSVGRSTLKNEKSRVWESMRNTLKYVESSSINNTNSECKWAKVWPCVKGDFLEEKKILDKKKEVKKMGVLICQSKDIDSSGTSDEERLKELGLAKIPFSYRKKSKVILVDQAVGENSGLIDGDYITVELGSKKGNRTYANVCLRGLTGMHLAELTRFREKTWKFCLFQALIALLAKTQFRYRYVWGANIDYIYQYAWMLYLYVGNLKIKQNQKFDDILVYNYKYSVELELVHELKDMPIIQSVDFKYIEDYFEKQRQKPRRELTVVKSTFGFERKKDKFARPIQKCTKVLEKWFDELDELCTNYILRTTNFSLAFWQDGCFWYLYNPYRSDKFGLWNDEGYACIMKFCTKDSLKRHLIILILRAYVLKQKQKKKSYHDINDYDENLKEPKTFTIQIFQLIYHSCKVHNVKLYQRALDKLQSKMVEKKENKDCTFDPIFPSQTPCADSDLYINDISAKVEKLKWLQNSKIPWTKYSTKRSICGKEQKENKKWHEFDVIEPRHLYILWGEIHITDRMFVEENRNKQASACYIICAGISHVNTPDYWNRKVLNTIIVSGDKFFTQTRLKCAKSSDILNDHNWNDKASDQFRIADTVFDFTIHHAMEGRLFVQSYQNLWKTLEKLFEEYRFGILKCENVHLGVFKHYSAYYILDVHSYGPPIFKNGHGSAYLLRTSCLFVFVKNLILLIGSSERSKFILRPVEITKITDISDQDKCV